MKLTTLVTTAITCALISGCASKPKSQTEQDIAAAQNKLGIKCETYAPTGSRIKKKICTTPEQREENKKAANEFRRQAQNQADGMGGS